MKISIRNARVHNLKSVSLDLPLHKLICFTGVSGSGKSSLAFDSIYIEGERRYVESLSQHARHFIGESIKPDLDDISGLSPTISIEQKTAGKNPRSTVGTLTEIYDYMRVLWAKVGTAHCPVSGETVTPRSENSIIESILSLPEGTKFIIIAPYVRQKKSEFKDEIEQIQKKGFTRIRVDGNFHLTEDTLLLEKNENHDLDIVVDRVESKKQNETRIKESIHTALELGSGTLIVHDPETLEDTFYSTQSFSKKSQLSYPPLDAQDFSFNSPHGMCPECQGLKIRHEFSLDLIIDKDKSIAEDCCVIATSYQTIRYRNIYDNLALIYNFNVHTPWKKLSEQAKKIFLYGTEKKWTRMVFVHPETGATWQDNVQWRGVLHEAYSKYQEAKSDRYKKNIEQYMKIGTCTTCHGARIKPYPAACTLSGKAIFEVTNMSIKEAISFFESITLSSEDTLIGKDLLFEIINRLKFLQNVGLEYLQLDRTAPTLSGGESQRVRLSSQIGSGLVDITYILDEPSIGLHPKDNTKLIASLRNLCDLGNTVIVVEHDEETIRAADEVVDFGPKAGSEGGNIVFQGSVTKLLECKNSVTGQYLSGRKKIPIPKKRRSAKGPFLTIKGASHNNLKEVTTKLPLGCFIAITGVSGSGKSSLLLETLYPAIENNLMRTDIPCGVFSKLDGLEHIDKVIEIDQSPIGRTPRSNPATYVKVFDEIRKLFSELPVSQAKGFKPGRFSFNVKEGSCSECHGLGMIKINMDFLDDSWIECPLCHGKRFDQETLDVTFKQKTIQDILDMDVHSAKILFENIPQIEHKLKTLCDVGLDYLKLGQSSTTLSGGEAQRIKLAKELCRPSTGKTLYILDEPTTGLHYQDMHFLLDVLHSFVDKGNTVVVIEHNMELVKTADWVIEMGPEGGDDGGYILGQGTPEVIAKKNFPTSRHLKMALDGISHEHAKSTKVKHVQDEYISIKGANQNNLKNLSLKIPRHKTTVFIGPSGAGKSSLAFETIFAEGQRRYVESLSAYIRQFVKQMPKPKIDEIQGISPAVALEAKMHMFNPRSTVGTMTEIYDFLRLLYSRLGIAHDPKTKEPIRTISKEFVLERILSYPIGTKVQILAPISKKPQDSYEELFERLKKQGFLRIRINKEYHNLDEEFSTFKLEAKKKTELFLVIDRVSVNPKEKLRIMEAISKAAQESQDKLILALPEQDLFFNLKFAVESTGESFAEITPQTFAFNTASGMCPTCQGLGFSWGVDLLSLDFIKNLAVQSLLGVIIDPSFHNKCTKDFFSSCFKTCKIEQTFPVKLLDKETLQTFMNGSDTLIPIEDMPGVKIKWRGINEAYALGLKLLSDEDSSNPQIPEDFQKALREVLCPICDGTRLNPLARNVTVKGRPIEEIVTISINDVLDFVKNITIENKKERAILQVLDELQSRLSFLIDVGLSYISLSRRASTLSGGEAQRVRLSRQIGSGLTGVTYILDEPSQGLHPKDTEQLLLAFDHIKNLGNTLLIVEQDPQIILEADHIVELGPKSGPEGGSLLFEGTVKNLLSSKESVTAPFLKSTNEPYKILRKRKKHDEYIHIQNAKVHNLKNISCKIPTNALVTITGVSGSGKSTLLENVLYEAAILALQKKQDVITTPSYEVQGLSSFSKVCYIDQKPMAQTLRSDVATYMDVLTPMRYFFASLVEAKAKGLEPKHFSTYHRKGMCKTCFGLGYKKIEMYFLPPVKILCPSCQGSRLNPLSLSVYYKGKNLGEILKLPIYEVREIFSNIPKVHRLLDMLIKVGLKYLLLGQEVHSLSGGESQRLKLAKEFAKKAPQDTLILLDEPTNGLHFKEVNILCDLIKELLVKGHSIIAIEHNIDFIKASEYIIDLGPKAGNEGGSIVAMGTLDEIMKSKQSITAKYLRVQNAKAK